MTLKTVVDAACDIVALDRIETLIGNDDPNAQTMLQLMQEAGDEIARRFDWARLLKTASVTTTPYPLPEDYQRLAPGGPVTDAAGNFIRAVLNGSQWTLVRGLASGQGYFFLSEGAIQFAPPASAIGASVDYVSAYWVQTTTGPQPGFDADDNRFLFPERLLTLGLVWRWRRQKRMAFDDELAEFEAALDIEAKANRGASQ